MTDNDMICECGVIRVPTSHIIERCQRTRFEGGVAALRDCGTTVPRSI